MPERRPRPMELMGFRTGDGTGPLSRLLIDKSLSPVFQPIVSMRDGSIYAHEALIRGPKGMPLHTPDALLAAARKEGLLLDFEIACVAAALEQWSARSQPGRLFVNLSASALLELVRARSADALMKYVRELGLQPRMLVIEITEHEHVSDIKGLSEAVQEVQAAGVMLALDDFGDGRSSLRLWSELQPDIVKIDKYFTAELSRHAKKLQTLRALMQIAEIFGTSLVAEGIETADDLRVVRDLGISLGQGYFMGRPIPQPRDAIEAQATEVLRDQRVSVMPAMRTASASGRRREVKIVHAPTVATQTTHDEIDRLLEAHPGLHAVAIVDQGVPVGLIDRRQFMERYAKRYFKELYGTKPCVTFANLSPRLVERDHDIDELVGILTSQDQRYLTEGFIVTENGRYVGLGTGDQLVRTVTESRIEAARHANPLTFLPGNIPITEHIERLLASGGEFVACYGDLNNFKPFNDHYGYWRGDEMIRLMASLSISHCDAQRDFVGHVGGDDFILLFQSDDWESRCERLVEAFNAGAAALYDEPGQIAGGIEAEDRHGVLRFFPFTSLSIGAVRVRKGQFRTAEQVANAAASAKHGAKATHAGLFVRQGESMFAELGA
ncbi:MAG: EAL domain-containing protein [Rhodoferax sp.]|nr:EAL domain-containing protein [Rhodoferax sp.]MDP3653805.1 EAL domain-containing protein [Rhodoferax sp.]